MPKYRVIYFTPEAPQGSWLGTHVARDDDEITLQMKRSLQQKVGWRVEIWRPDRKKLVATVSGPEPK
jgi:hypothetical protein